jgi:hypothetical protein
MGVLMSSTPMEPSSHASNCSGFKITGMRSWTSATNRWLADDPNLPGECREMVGRVFNLRKTGSRLGSEGDYENENSNCNHAIADWPRITACSHADGRGKPKGKYTG